MNHRSQSGMLEALRLTRSGKLAQATALLQATLRGVTTSQTADVNDATFAVPPLETLALPAAKACDRVQVRPATVPVRLRKNSIAPESALQGVNGTQKRGDFLDRTFTNTAGTRTYKVYVPAHYDGSPAPLVVMLHGCTQSSDDFARGTRMNELADEFGCLIAYPEQSVRANSAKCWNWFNRRDQQRDLGEPSLVAGITLAVIRDYAVDRKRVYVAGMSAGGAAAAVVASAYPDLFAGLGVHSGLTCGLASNLPSALTAMKGRNADASAAPNDSTRMRRDASMPTIVFQGDRDTTVHPSNADLFVPALPASSRRLVATSRAHGGRSFTQTTHRDERGVGQFEQWIIHGAGHAWSGGSECGSYTDPHGPDASREMLRFFLSHQLSDR